MSELEQALRELRVDWPPTPDLAGAVRARIATEPAPRRRSWLPRRGEPRFALALGLAAVLAVAVAGLAASPSARSAILEFLGLKGARIERREPTGARPAPPAERRIGDTLGLGDPVTLEEARRRAGFDVRVPEALGAPDAVYFEGAPPEGGRVSLVYGPRPGMAAQAGGAALLLTQFQATVEPVIEKTAGEGARVERLTVDGEPGFFISGDPHGFAWVGPDGEVLFEEARLAAPTLLLEQDGLLVRVEGDVTRRRAIEIARSLR